MNQAADGQPEPRNAALVRLGQLLGEWTLTLESGGWEMVRRDPDFHQRLVGDVTADRIILSADASEDDGRTWRKDLDLTFERRH